MSGLIFVPIRGLFSWVETGLKFSINCFAATALFLGPILICTLMEVKFLAFFAQNLIKNYMSLSWLLACKWRTVVPHNSTSTTVTTDRSMFIIDNLRAYWYKELEVILSMQLIKRSRKFESLLDYRQVCSDLKKNWMEHNFQFRQKWDEILQSVKISANRIATGKIVNQIS